MSISKARCDQPVTAILQREFGLSGLHMLCEKRAMPKTHARRYLIEIKDAKGVVLFSSAAYWGDKDRRLGIARITRLTGLPAVNFYAEPALEPDPGERKAYRRTDRKNS